MGTKNIHEIYKCNICGNIVEVLKVGEAELICCGQPMELLEEKNQDEGLEKHAPVIKKTEQGVKVKVGATEHPMTVEHYIEWIEIVTEDGRRGKKFLKPGDKPQVEFCTCLEVIGARAYCNLHGLWRL